MIEWHRLLGLMMIDHFSGTSFEVSLESDLSKRQKLLDILLISGSDQGDAPKDCPVGLSTKELCHHNLISFKSFQESFSSDAVEHLMSCVADYRYAIQAEKRPHDGPELLPNDQLKAIAVTARYPKKLADNLGPDLFQETDQAGVYRMTWGTRSIQVIVCRRVEVCARNALWLLFSGDESCIDFGMQHFGLNNQDMSTILSQVSQNYQLGGLNMPYTLEDFKREITLESIKKLSPEERKEFFSQLSVEDRLEGLGPRERVEGLEPKERVEGLEPKERVEGLEPKERVEGLSQEELAELRKLLDESDDGLDA